MKSDIDKEIAIAFQMDAESNRLLNQSTKASGRSKKVEAAMRLKDHLKRYGAIVRVGQAIPIDEGSHE